MDSGGLTAESILQPQATLPPSLMFGALIVSQGNAGHLGMRILIYKGGPRGATQGHLAGSCQCQLQPKKALHPMPPFLTRGTRLDLIVDHHTPNLPLIQGPFPLCKWIHHRHTEHKPRRGSVTCQRAWATSGTSERIHQPQPPSSAYSPLLPKSLAATSYSLLPVRRKDQS